MIPAAELKVRVAIEGIPQGNAKLQAFEGNLKRVSGYDASATLRANVEGRGFEEFDARASEIRRQAMRPIEQDVRADVDEASFVAAQAQMKALKANAGGSGIRTPWWLSPGVIAAASPPVLQLSGALTGLAGSFTEAALGAGALAIGGYGTASVGIGGIVGVAVPAVKSLVELKKAQDAYTEAVATYGKNSTQAETAGKKVRAAARMAGPEAQNVAKALSHVGDEWMDLTKAGRGDFLGALGDGLDHLDRKLPVLARSANRSTSAMRRDFNSFLEEVTGRGSGFDRFIDRMTDNFDAAGPDISHALADWVKIFERIAIAVSPDMLRGLDSFSDWSDDMLASTGNARELRRDVHGLVEQTGDWFDLLVSGGDFLLTLFGEGAGEGQHMVRGMAGTFDDWTRSIEENRGEVREFFGDAREGTEHLLSATAGVAEQWYVVARALEPVEHIVLDITEALNSVKIGDFSALTLLLTGGFVASSAGKALAIYNVVRGYRDLRAVLAGQAAVTSATAVASGRAATAATAEAAANARLAGSLRAVTAARGPLLVANSSGAVVGTAGAAAGAAGGAGRAAAAGAGGGILSRTASRAISSPFAKVGAVAGGYFAAEFGAKAIEGITGKDFLEDQNLFESLTHGFNTSKRDGALSEAEGNLKASELTPGALDYEKRAALEQAFEGMMAGLSVSAIAGMGEINRNLSQGLAITNSIWARETPTWRKHTAEAMERAVASIRAGMKLGAIPVERGQREINRLLGQIHLVRGDDPLGLAEATTKSFKRANGITAAGVNDWMRELDRLPKGARQKTIDATMGMLRAWAEGHPKIESQIDALTRYQIVKFGATNKQLREGVRRGATGPIADAYRELAAGSAQALENLGINTNRLLKALGAEDMVQFKALVLTGGSGSLPKFSGGEHGAKSHNAKPKDYGFQSGGIIPGVTEGDSVERAVRPRTFILNREATRTFGFNEGGLVPVVLEPGEREFTPEEVDRIGLDTLMWMNSAVPRFANGGEVAGQVSGPGAIAALGHGALSLAFGAAQKRINKNKPKPAGGAAPKDIGSSAVDQMLEQAIAIGSRHGSTVSDLNRPGASSFHNWNYAPPHKAADLAGGNMMATAKAIIRHFGAGRILELFYNPLGFEIDNYSKRPMSVMDHYDHVHVAFQDGGLVGQGRSRAVGLQNGGYVDASAAQENVALTIAQHLLGRGLNYKGAAGIIGNAWRESLWNPAAEGTGGGGLWGFTTPPISLADLKSTAAAKGKSWTDIGFQTGFMWSGPEPASAHKAALNNQPNAAAAAEYFDTEWERSGIKAMSDRKNGAREAMRLMLGADMEGGGKDTPVPDQVEGKYTKHKKGSTGKGGGTYAEDVRARYRVQTEFLNFDSVPDTVKGCTRELNLRRRQLGEYRAAARQTKDPDTRHDLEANAKALERRIDALRKQRDRLRREERVKRAVKKINEAAEFKAWTAPGGLFEQREAAFSELEERADQKVSLEPQEPQSITPEWVNSTLKPYIEGMETPAYGAVLQAAADWRNTLLGAENFAEVKIGDWNAQIENLRKNIETLQELKTKHPQAWAKRKGEIPGMRAKIKALHSNIAKTRDTTLPEWESTLGGVQGLGRTHEIMPGLPSEPSELFGGDVFRTQLTIQELGLKVPNALAGVTDDRSEQLELELELERRANRRLKVEDALTPVLQQFESSYPMSYMGAFAEGGVALVGERGPELAHFPSGTRVHTATDTERMLNGAGQLRVIVNGSIRQEPGDTRDPIEILEGSRRFDAYIEQKMETFRGSVPTAGGGSWRP